MSTTYLVYGTTDEAVARAAVEEAVREEADKALDELAGKIAGGIAKGIQTRHAAAVAKARRVDSERLDKCLDTLEEMKADMEDISEASGGLKALAARLKKATAGLAGNEPRRFN